MQQTFSLSLPRITLRISISLLIALLTILILPAWTSFNTALAEETISSLPSVQSTSTPSTSSTEPAFDLTEVVHRAEELMRGQSHKGTITLEVIKPDWSRTISMKIWGLGSEQSLVLITAPARDKGNAMLKRGNEVWNWVSNIERVIKIPPSMMLQSWLGSDFTFDDMVKESSILDDYDHKLLGTEVLNWKTDETTNGIDCYIVELTPKADAAVVWGRIEIWIAKQEYWQLKVRYYDEDGEPTREMRNTDIRDLGGRRIPTRWELTPFDKPGNRTVFSYQNMEFGADLEESFFSISSLKRLR